MFKTLSFFFLMITSSFNNYCKGKEMYRDEIRSLMVSFKLPMINKDGKITGYYESFFKIYFYGNLVMYQFRYHYDFPDTNSLGKEKLFKNEIRNRFFVYEKNDTHGFSYDEYKKESPIKLRVDSLINSEGLGNVNLNQLFKKNLLSLIKSNKDSASGILEEVYVGNMKKDSTFNDTAFFYLTDKLRNLDFSLLKELEDIKKLKVYKIRIVSNAEYIEEFKVTLGAREVNFELKEIPISNRKELLDYFNRYKRDYVKNKTK